MIPRRSEPRPDCGTRPLSECRVTKDAFKAEIRRWSDRIGVAPSEIHIRPMTRKWGSCSTTGRVTFSADLLETPADFRNRVIVEELLHLKIPNHGKLFKAVLRAYLEMG